MGQTNAMNAVIAVSAGNEMNAIATKMVGRGSRMAHRDNGEIAHSTSTGFVRPLSLPSRSQRAVSIKTFLYHILNYGSARFPAQNIPKPHTVQTSRTPAIIREPRPTNYDL